MSIGSQPKEERFEISTLRQIKYSVEKSLVSFWKKPLENLFHLNIILAIIGLFFNMTFRLEFYIILIILGLVQLYKFFYPTEKELLLNEKTK